MVWRPVTFPTASTCPGCWLAAFKVAPSLNPVAASLTFSDTDNFAGEYGGAVSFTRPAGDSALDSYR